MARAIGADDFVFVSIRCSIVVSISACHAEDPGSIPGGGVIAAASAMCSGGKRIIMMLHHVGQVLILLKIVAGQLTISLSRRGGCGMMCDCQSRTAEPARR